MGVILDRPPYPHNETTPIAAAVGGGLLFCIFFFMRDFAPRQIRPQAARRSGGQTGSARFGGAGRRRPCGPRLSPQILLFRGAYRSSQCCTRPMALSQPRRLRSRTSAAILGVYSLSSVHCSRISSKSLHTPVASPAR